jgi:hypothetical protein
MATAYKVLGQVEPSANTLTTLYTCPASTEAVVSTITVCNRDGLSSNFRIAVRPNGAAIDDKHYLVYDAIVGGIDTVALTLGITVDASDVISVRSTNANTAFNAFGSEIS